MQILADTPLGALDRSWVMKSQTTNFNFTFKLRIQNTFFWRVQLHPSQNI